MDHDAGVGCLLCGECVGMMATSAQITPKGRELVRAIAEAEKELAAIWRERYEDYEPSEQLEWRSRQRQASKIYQALWDQV